MDLSRKNLNYINDNLEIKLGKDKFNYILSLHKKQKAGEIINLFFEKISNFNKKYNTNFIKNQYNKYEFLKCEDCEKNFIIFKKDFLNTQYDACADGSAGYSNCCWKTCCPSGCLRRLGCGHYNTIYPDDLEYNNGNVNCNICDYKDKLSYRWWGESTRVYIKKYGM